MIRYSFPKQSLPYSYMQRFPSLLGLRAFEAAGRLSSFSQAACELSVTPSAISHQIRKLEDELGTALFRRSTRTITLTDAGETYLQTVKQAFALLTEGSRHIRQSTRTSLRISLLASFASNWLMPRLDSFTEAYPAIDFRLDPSVELTNFSASDNQLAIRYGRGGWPEVEARCLMLEHLAPVCSPAFLRQHPQLREFSDVAAVNLLMANAKMEYEWRAWSRMTGVNLASARITPLRDYNIVLQAALAGQGVAMGRGALIAEHLQSGRLIEPLGPAIPMNGIGYWVLTPHGTLSEEVTMFRNWLITEAASFKHFQQRADMRDNEHL
ncbi:transcriptional regulator GcvA [Collimonas sp.]|jgi:LysR family glycine cleavage system transcriptional activator|uniref:transcriptional regulator GcvA n=1 Tax=Collimonas sp. TaxID=1963772 RepID=UPI002BDFD0FE|nr:transcriptional regulator GcvA [Collimonas sp.]HWW04498.1 transcriptional regulator GcvA [Collimonas sp.]